MDDKLKSYSGDVVTSLPWLHERHAGGISGERGMRNVHALVCFAQPKAKTFIW